MKLLTIAFILTTLSAAHANPAREALGMTMAPTAYSLMFPVMSSLGCHESKNPSLCGAAMTVSYAALSVSTAALLKEEIKTVEVDSYDFLAGGPMTLALEEVINAVRSEEQHLEQASDEIVVTLMLNSL